MEPAVAGPGPPRGQLPSLRTESTPGRRSDLIPSGSQRGVGAGSGASARPVLSLRAATGALTPGPLWAALCPQPRVSLRLCGDHGEGHQGTVLTRSPGVRAWKDLWSVGSQPLLFDTGGPLSS